MTSGAKWESSSYRNEGASEARKRGLKSIVCADGGAVIMIGVLCALSVLEPRRLAAQKKTAEFTRQGLLITDFAPRGTADLGFGRKAADEVRSRIAKLSNKREVEVISGGDFRYQLERSGIPDDTILDERTIRQLGRLMRADEYVLGTVERAPKSVRITGRLILMRDPRLTEPLPSATAPELGLAVDQFARAFAAARAELAPQRRCENALRDAQPERALQAARDAVAAYPSGVLAHVCLAWALRATGASATEVLEAARHVLAGDSLNPHGLESAAIALDSLHRRDESATEWLRLADTDTANLELTERVVLSMVYAGNSRRAEPLIVRAAEAHADSLSLRRLEWRVAYENRHWPVAIKAGEDSSLMRSRPHARRLPSTRRSIAVS